MPRIEKAKQLQNELVEYRSIYTNPLKSGYISD